MNINKLHKKYLEEGSITIHEWFNGVFNYCNESNIQEVLETMPREIKSIFLNKIDNFPKTEEDWEDYEIIASYCGSRSGEDYTQIIEETKLKDKKKVIAIRHEILE